MNILIIGSGGREHAIAKSIKQSDKCDKLFVLPGNAGTAQIATNVPLAITDFVNIGKFSIDNDVKLIIVGPEEPLVKGIRNFFEADDTLKQIALIGPGENGAMLEGSKDFSKQFMMKHHIPTAQYRTFTFDNIHEGIEYVKQHTLPIVLKADGLAAGKGVLICDTHEQAIDELQQMIKQQKFGVASSKVVVEEFLTGIELSIFVLTDGKNYIVLPEAKDYKRIGEGDTGLNTGGMGAVSPVPFANADFMNKVEQQIVRPTIDGLHADQIPYCGFIFIGLMNVNGNPFVIEYNCRMGDPETEVVFPRIKSDTVDMMIAAATGTIHNYQLQVVDEAAATVVLVSAGYPGAYETGKVISIPENTGNSIVFHAGTKITNQGIVTSGGRVISITSLGNTIHEAAAQSKHIASLINFEGKYFRSDIGFEFT
jgi:phosphoribosylamine--glycine ligase